MRLISSREIPKSKQQLNGGTENVIWWKWRQSRPRSEEELNWVNNNMHWNGEPFDLSVRIEPKIIATCVFGYRDEVIYG